MAGLRRVATGVVVVAILALTAACGGSRASNDVATGSEADVLGFVSSSGAEAAAAPSFRYSYENLDASDYNQMCRVSLKWDGAMDVTRQLAFFDLRDADGPSVILSADTMYVKAAALSGWHIPTPWLSVPLSDLQDLNDVDVALGVSLGPKFWSKQDSVNPTTAFDALKETVTSVSEQGTETVRGVDTTRYDLTIDPEKAGIWSGDATTTTTTPDAAAARAARQKTLDQIIGKAPAGSPPMSDEAKAAFLDGDLSPLVDYLEHTTGTSMSQDDRAFLGAMTSGDPTDMVESMESSTGTSMDPAAKRMLESMGGSGGIGKVFSAFTEVTASAWVDHDGTLRRLQQRIAFTGGDTEAAAPDHPLLDARLEFWDIGVPITDAVPAASDLTDVAALSRTTDIPTALSPCYMRVPK